jgi:hypothetical protein
MTEPFSETPPRDRRMTTGEFRAQPDISANTAQFQAFAAGREQTGQWAATAPARNHTRLALLILAVVAVVVIIAVLAVTL